MKMPEAQKSNGNGEPLKLSNLLWALGLLLLAFVGYDLVARGFQQVPGDPAWPVPGGDPERGRVAIVRYGCGACHRISGVRGANGRVGPQLTDFAEQIYIAGRLPNTPANLALWIRNAQAVDPQTAMPDLPVTEAEARDIAAYLYADR